jgi:predicted MFS family arabinose efflux permease
MVEKSRMKPNKILWILAFVCLIDSIGFGIMIPLIYSYGKQFGLNKATLGLLTTAFSVAQFFATPVLGALSDKIGRKLLLIICLIGTCLSFVLFGLAGSLLVLFAARILDGLTGGDISVAQAMVADISPGAERAKNFGILGSAFGLGYVIGPAMGGLLSGFGMRVPFFFAAGLSLTGAILSMIFLKETHKRGGAKRPHFSYKALITIFKRPVVGPAVLTGFLLTTAQFVMLIGFQTFCSDKLKLTPTQIGLFYGGFGLSGIVMQLIVPLINKYVPSRSLVLMASTVFCVAAMILCGFSGNMIPFAVGIGTYGLFNGLRNPMLNAIIADHAKGEEEGQVMGINQSYTSIGQAVGPAIAGLAAFVSLQSPFYLAALLIFAGLVISVKLKQRESPQ